MFFIWNQQSVFVKKYGLSLFEGNAMLAQIGRCLARIPFESNRLHFRSLDTRWVSSKIELNAAAVFPISPRHRVIFGSFNDQL